jgi:hypothetical protein
MSFEIILTETFQRKAKYLITKFPSFKAELKQLTDSLAVNPDQGTPLGHHCYKIRLAIKLKGKGKSGGARVITFLRLPKQKLYLIDIYDKSEQSNISDKELRLLIELLAQ